MDVHLLLHLERTQPGCQEENRFPDPSL